MTTVVCYSHGEQGGVADVCDTATTAAVTTVAASGAADGDGRAFRVRLSEPDAKTTKKKNKVDDTLESIGRAYDSSSLSGNEGVARCVLLLLLLMRASVG